MDRPTEKYWSAGNSYTLRFPVPLSQNAKNALVWRSSGNYTKRKNEAKDAAYWRAREQLNPPDPVPEHVHIHAHFRMHSLRDEDKLPASLEWILDGLKGHYFVDDGPKNLILICSQEICRVKQRQGVTLTITPA